MTDPASATLEQALTAEVARMYEEVVSHPNAEYHFHTGRHAAEQFDMRASAFAALKPGP